MDQAWWGTVLRCNESNAIASAWGASGFCSSALQAEALACLEALKAMDGQNHANIVVESDCLSLVHYLQGDVASRSELCFLLQEIRQLASCFLSCKFSWIRRDANSTAHALARFARESSSSRSLAGLPPSWEHDVANNLCNPDLSPVN